MDVLCPTKVLKRPNLPARIFAQKKGGKRGCELHPEDVVVDAFTRVACTHGGVLMFCYQKWRFLCEISHMFSLFLTCPDVKRWAWNVCELTRW